MPRGNERAWERIRAKKGQDIIIECECGNDFCIDKEKIEEMNDTVKNHISKIYAIHRCPECRVDVFAIREGYRMLYYTNGDYKVVSKQFIKEY